MLRPKNKDKVWVGQEKQLKHSGMSGHHLFSSLGPSALGHATC